MLPHFGRLRRSKCWYDAHGGSEYVSQLDRVVAAHCEIESISAGGAVNRTSTRLGIGQHL